MLEEVDERLGMALGVHAHEGAELQEAGVDPPPAALEFPRHGSDQIVAEPRVRLFVGELVDLVGRDPHVDRPRHQGQARGLDIGAVHRHDRGRGERRDGRLADRDDMAILADMADEIDQVPGIVLQPEAARVELDVARIDPVGEIDLMVAQHRPQRAAQQRGEMAGHRRHQQHLRIVGAALLRKMQQLAERRAHRAVLRHRARSRRAPRRRRRRNRADRA